MLKATSSIVNVSQITGVLPVVNGGTGVTTSTGTGNTVLSAAPTLSGNVTLSTGNLIVASGQGIDFSATPGTGTSELLADYEEGTWTPTRTGFVEVLGAGSITSSGRYTKVGNTVTVQAQIVCAGGATIAATSGIGSYLSGLPFVPTSLGAGEWVNGSSVADQGSMLVHTNTDMYLTKGWVASSSAFYFSATYLAS